MKYVLDTEFIDTPEDSHLISLALVREDGESVYFEFPYPDYAITDWLQKNVVPHLTGELTSFADAARRIRNFIGNDWPEIWCYYGAYDWYWFCRVFGGFMRMPQHWDHRFKEFADYQQGVPVAPGESAHNALSDCRSILIAMKGKGLL